MAGELILIVDDEDLIRNQAEAALQRFNYRTISASTAAQAMQSLKDNPPQLILCDIRMPGTDGLQLFAAARRMLPEVAVVIMTGLASTDTVLKALQLGINGFLLKPFTGSELERGIKNALEKQQVLQEAAQNRILDHLLDWQKLLNSQPDPASILSFLVQKVAFQLSLDYCAIYQPHPTAPGGFVSAAVQAAPTAHSFEGKGFPVLKLLQKTAEEGRVFSLKRAVPPESALAHEQNKEMAVPGAIMVVPAICAGQLYSVFIAGREEVNRPFSPVEKRLMEALGVALGIAERNAALTRRVEDREGRLTNLAGRMANGYEEEKRLQAMRLQDEIIPLLASSRKTIQEYLTKVRPSSAGELYKTEQRLHSAVNEAKRLLQTLHPPELAEFGLSSGLRKYLREVSESEGGCKISFKQEGPEAPRLEPPVEMAFFRAVQEVVNNACRHAQNETPVEVTLQVWTLKNKPQRFEIVIRDQGKGFDSARLLAQTSSESSSLALGLRTVQERIILAGGECRIESQPGKGTTVTLAYQLVN